ncbi:hypothetical protein LTR94_026275 [Friedmanniomyces endolithicus]|nr:hypothetical protein LTR94_026275 [Friedmanniomyces endolithicus]
MSEKSLTPGERVSWAHSQGRSTGKVVRKLTGRSKIKGHEVAASKEEPEYLVQSEETGAKAAHRPEALRRI